MNRARKAPQARRILYYTRQIILHHTVHCTLWTYFHYSQFHHFQPPPLVPFAWNCCVFCAKGRPNLSGAPQPKDLLYQERPAYGNSGGMAIPPPAAGTGFPMWTKWRAPNGGGVGQTLSRRKRPVQRISSLAAPGIKKRAMNILLTRPCETGMMLAGGSVPVYEWFDAMPGRVWRGHQCNKERASCRVTGVTQWVP